MTSIHVTMGNMLGLKNDEDDERERGDDMPELDYIYIEASNSSMYKHLSVREREGGIDIHGGLSVRVFQHDAL